MKYLIDGFFESMKTFCGKWRYEDDKSESPESSIRALENKLLEWQSLAEMLYRQLLTIPCPCEAEKCECGYGSAIRVYESWRR